MDGSGFIGLCGGVVKIPWFANTVVRPNHHAQAGGQLVDRLAKNLGILINESTS